jgi:hypothetical protein
MAIDLFGANTTGSYNKAPGAGVTGPWLDVRSTVGKTYPHRITAYGGFTGDVVYIERIDGDNTISANVIQVAQLANLNEIVVDAPTDWLRARTGAGLVGTAEVLMSPTA